METWTLCKLVLAFCTPVSSWAMVVDLVVWMLCRLVWAFCTPVSSWVRVVDLVVWRLWRFSLAWSISIWAAAPISIRASRSLTFFSARASWASKKAACSS